MSALLNYVFYSAAALIGWYLLARRAGRGQRLGVVALVASFVIAWVTWWFTSEWPLGDFNQAYWPAGASFTGEGPSLGDLIRLGVRGFVNLPIVAVLFVPFGWMAPDTAGRVFTVLGALAAVASWWLIARLTGLDATKRWLLLYLFAANGPLIYSAEFGNTSHVVLLAIAVTLLLWRTRAVVAGVVLGIAAIIKLPLVLLAGFLLVRRQWFVLGGMMIALGVATVSSIVWFGWDLHVMWYAENVRPFFGGSMPAYNVQTIPGFVARLQTGGAGLRLWEPVVLVPGGRMLAALATGALLVIGLWPSLRAWFRTRRSPTSMILELEFVSALIFVVIGSTLAWSHYYAWMLLPIAYLLANPIVDRDPVSRRLAFAGAWLTSLPVFPLYLPEGVFKEVFSRTAASYLLLGGVLLFLALARVRALAAQLPKESTAEAA